MKSPSARAPAFRPPSPNEAASFEPSGEITTSLEMFVRTLPPRSTSALSGGGGGGGSGTDRDQPAIAAMTASPATAAIATRGARLAGAFAPATSTGAVTGAVGGGVVSAAGCGTVVYRKLSSASAALNSPAVANRSAGSFSSALASTPATCGGTVWRKSVIDRGCSVRIRTSTPCAVGAANGG